MLPGESCTGPWILSGLNTPQPPGVVPSGKALDSAAASRIGAFGSFCHHPGHWLGLALSCLLLICSLHSTSNPSLHFCEIEMPSWPLPAMLSSTHSASLPVPTCINVLFVPSLLWEKTSVSHSLGVKATCPSQPPPGCPRLPRAAPLCPPGNTQPRDCIMHTFRLQVPHGQGLCCLSWLHLFH